MIEQLTDTDKRHFAQMNADSFEVIPDTHLSEGDRLAYIQRALEGEDVYAYESGPPPVVYNIWDTDVRIVQPLLEKRWTLVQCALIDDGLAWALEVQRGEKRHAFLLRIAHTPLDTTPEHYTARAQRVIQDVLNHAAQYDINPSRFHLTWH